MKPLKICIFTETYYPVVGGGETQAKLLAEGLIAKGHSVILLTRRSDKTLKKIEQFEALSVYRLPPVGRGQLKKWGLIISSLPLLLKLNRHYDLIFVSGFRIIGMTAVLVSKLINKSCVLKADSRGELSGDFFDNGLRRFGFSHMWLPFRILLNLRNYILRKTDAFAAISPEIASELISNGIPSKKISLIPNSVDTDRFFPVNFKQKSRLREMLDLPQVATIVIYTGRLVSYKGLPLLLKVWKEICCNHKDVYLLLVGTGGLDIHNCEAELRNYVHANGLKQNVRFTGSVQNVPEFLQASDIFAFPTENDAFPSSLIEAMACALSVVSTPVGAINTIVRDKQNGLLIKPGDFHQLYQAIDTLILNQDLSARLGQVAWKNVQDYYSADIVTKQYLTLFNNTITS